MLMREIVDLIDPDKTDLKMLRRIIDEIDREGPLHTSATLYDQYGDSVADLTAELETMKLCAEINGICATATKDRAIARESQREPLHCSCRPAGAFH